ncbi:MAG TPA: choice-of-anchor Q domain-containing protein, partial [Rhodanobacteraceae bacterium]
DGGNATISNSTIAFNTTNGLLYGSAVFLTTTADLESTIVIDNLQIGVQTQENDIGGVSGATLTGARNLVGFSLLDLPGDTLRIDPLLQPLAYNGGPTRTHALLVGSAALDAGNDVVGLSNDQRGVGHPRTIGSAPDIGAFELDPDAIFANGFD